MDLKSGTLFWPAQQPSARTYPILHQDISCDVAVLGGGLTGAMTAATLVEAGLDVVLADKRAIARGSTSASTALLLYEIDTPLFQLAGMIGRRDAERSYQLCLDAIARIEQRIRPFGDDCGFARKRSLYLTRHARVLPDLKNEFQARLRAGLRVEYLTAADLKRQYAVAAAGAILSVDAAELDPYRFTHQLVENAVPRGLRVFAHTRVNHLEEARSRVTLRVDGGHTIAARKVVIAAGYESQCYLEKKVVQLKSTYVIATRPLKQPREGPPLIWEMARPYCYLRTTCDGRIMIGGEDEDFYDPVKRDRLIPEKTRRLEEAINRLLPGLKAKADYAWAGTFGETKDSLPRIGRVRGHPHVIYALCYGANGTNFAVIAADIIHDWVLKKRNRDARIFSLDR